jgi:hypothetical protein
MGKRCSTIQADPFSVVVPQPLNHEARFQRSNLNDMSDAGASPQTNDDQAPLALK